MTRRLYLRLMLKAIFFGSICSPLAAQNPDLKILFSGRVYQRAGRSYEQLWEIRLRDQQKVKLSATARDHKQPVCSPHEPSIVFIPSGLSGRQRSWRDEIWSFDRRNGQERRLFKASADEHFGTLLGWSPDGKELFLSVDSHGTSLIAKLQIQQGQFVRLAEGVNPVLAPDGSRLAYRPPSQGTGTPTGSEVIIIDAQGKMLDRLSNAGLPAAWPSSTRPWSPDGVKFAYVSSDFTQLRIIDVRDKKDLVSIPLPERSEHWNYPTSVSWSPDGKLILVGGQAGSSTAHFEDYWLLDWEHQSWQYAGGGNGARWSPDGSEILWSTPRELAPWGRRRGWKKCPSRPAGTYDNCQFHYVWASHLVLVETHSLQQQFLTSGVSYNTDHSWCAKQ